MHHLKKIEKCSPQTGPARMLYPGPAVVLAVSVEHYLYRVDNIEGQYSV